MRELVENDSLTAKTLGEEGIKDIYKIADKLGAVAGEAAMGLGNRIVGAINSLSELAVTDDAARKMFYGVLSETKPDKLPGAIFALGRTIKSGATSQLSRQTARGAAFRAGEANQQTGQQ